MKSSQLVDRFQRARHDNALAIIEGVQALKHAARFNATFEHIITVDGSALKDLLTELAPDTIENIMTQTIEVNEQTFNRLSPRPHRTQVIALAKRNVYTLENLESAKPVIFLEDPKDLENIGAVIRVSAAADVAAVCISGPIDIWSPAIIRGAAGLQFALPVFNCEIELLLTLGRRVISLDPTGDETRLATAIKNSIFVFGTERHGISSTLLKKSHQIIRLPMKKGVSSLNLATSVAATLYSLN